MGTGPAGHHGRAEDETETETETDDTTDIRAHHVPATPDKEEDDDDGYEPIAKVNGRMAKQALINLLAVVTDTNPEDIPNLPAFCRQLDDCYERLGAERERFRAALKENAVVTQNRATDNKEAQQ